MLRIKIEVMQEHTVDAQPKNPGQSGFLLTFWRHSYSLFSDAGSTDADKPLTDFTLLNAASFQPVLVHKPHAPMPIAMVNRLPHGTPNHADDHVPQNAAWLAGFKLARRSIMVYTPMS